MLPVKVKPAIWRDAGPMGRFLPWGWVRLGDLADIVGQDHDVLRLLERGLPLSKDEGMVTVVLPNGEYYHLMSVERRLHCRSLFVEAGKREPREIHIPLVGDMNLGNLMVPAGWAADIIKEDASGNLFPEDEGPTLTMPEWQRPLGEADRGGWVPG